MPFALRSTHFPSLRLHVQNTARRIRLALHHRLVVRLLELVRHTPLEPGPEVVLEMLGPALRRVVPAGRAVPRIRLVRPEELLSGRPHLLVGRTIRARSITPRPAAPGRLHGIAQTGGDEIDEAPAIPLLLRGVERAERAASLLHVLRHLEAPGVLRQRPEAVVPALAVDRGITGLDVKENVLIVPLPRRPAAIERHDAEAAPRSAGTPPGSSPPSPCRARAADCSLRRCSIPSCRTRSAASHSDRRPR